jgi:hypothetical protein
MGLANNSGLEDGGLKNLTRLVPLFDFETGDMSRWDDAPNMSAQSSIVYNGVYSGFTNHSNNNYSAKNVVFGSETTISAVSYARRETGDGNGIAVVWYDGSGNEVARTGSSNITIDAEGAGGVTNITSPNDNNFHTIKISFDWINGTFDVTADSSTTETLSLKSSDGIKRFEIWAVGAVNDSLGGGSIIDAWFDEFDFTL